MQRFQLVLVWAVFSIGLACDRLVGPQCPNANRPISQNCPLTLESQGQSLCYKMITAPFGSAYTRRSATEACKKDGGKGRKGHLADILTDTNFQKIWCYVAEETTPTRDRDPKILLGMRYNTKTGTVTTHGGNAISVQDLKRWGRFRPLSYGDYFMMRGHCQYRRTKIMNFGDEDTRFERILCAYLPK